MLLHFCRLSALGQQATLFKKTVCCWASHLHRHECLLFFCHVLKKPDSWFLVSWRICPCSFWSRSWGDSFEDCWPTHHMTFIIAKCSLTTNITAEAQCTTWPNVSESLQYTEALWTLQSCEVPHSHFVFLWFVVQVLAFQWFSWWEFTPQNDDSACH